MTAELDTLPDTPLIITCEHGGNRIPPEYQTLFSPCQALLDSHRGFDAGALIMAEAMALSFKAPLLASTVSRLLVDLNRSAGHRQLHADQVFALSAEQRHRILSCYYQPYRQQAEQLVAKTIAHHGRVVHIACHSFTPELHGKVRSADAGLLYDATRPGEQALCKHWQRALRAGAPELVVRRNYPYNGRNDGLTTWLRQQHPGVAYMGIELELNQKHTTRPTDQWKQLRTVVIQSLRDTLIAHASNP